MEDAGVMKTLAEPTLTAISGEQATFRVGGEFNLVTSQTDGDNGSITYEMEKLEYGIGLEFQPVVLSAGRISLKVRTSVSEPTNEGSVALSGGARKMLPGTNMLSIRKRLADTTVELPSGGSMMIAGLVRDDVRQAVNGLPGLSKLPVLGTLFRSRDFVRNETELVIIVTPYLSRPVARNELAKPEDNFNAAERRRRPFPRSRQPRFRLYANQFAKRPLLRRRRLHLQVSRVLAMADIALKTRPLGPRNAGIARRMLESVLQSPPCPVAGCAKRDSITVGAVPDDYRTNHPIVIAEKEEILDLPVGASDRGITQSATGVTGRISRV